MSCCANVMSILPAPCSEPRHVQSHVQSHAMSTAPCLHCQYHVQRPAMLSASCNAVSVMPRSCHVVKRHVYTVSAMPVLSCLCLDVMLPAPCCVAGVMSGRHVKVIPCHHVMQFSHVIMSCYHVVSCYHVMLPCHVAMSCYYIILATIWGYRLKFKQLILGGIA